VKIMTQGDLFQTEEKPTREHSTADEDIARRMVHSVAADGGWRTRADMHDAIGLTDRPGGQIIFGPRGYCLTSRATIEDVRHCYRTLKSQADDMLRQAQDVWREMNKGEPHG